MNGNKEIKTKAWTKKQENTGGAASSNQHIELISKLGSGPRTDRFGFENGAGLYLNRFTVSWYKNKDLMILFILDKESSLQNKQNTFSLSTLISGKTFEQDEDTSSIFLRCGGRWCTTVPEFSKPFFFLKFLYRKLLFLLLYPNLRLKFPKKHFSNILDLRKYFTSKTFHKHVSEHTHKHRYGAERRKKKGCKRMLPLVDRKSFTAENF